MVSHVFIVVDMLAGSEDPGDCYRYAGQCEQDEGDGGADEEGVGDVVGGEVADVGWEGLHFY